MPSTPSREFVVKTDVFIRCPGCSLHIVPGDVVRLLGAVTYHTGCLKEPK